jgi:hypothetical protein
MEEKMNGFTHRTAALVAALSIGVLLAIAPAALAQSSSVDTYGGSGGKVQSQINDPVDPGDPSATADTSSALPFTGLDLGLAAGGAFLLLGAGASMAMLSSRTRRSEL